jgi:alkylation response protein AidB-like acyl-CoA dehydrogenase
LAELPAADSLKLPAPPAPSEHAALLRDTVAAFVADAGGVSRARRLRGTAHEFDRAMWSRMAELGWIGALVPEAHGGSALTLTEAAVIAEELAAALAPEPFTASAVVATTALMASDNEALKRAFLPDLAAGRVIVSPAWRETRGDLGPGTPATRLTRFEGGYRLNGTKRYIAGAAGCDGYLVSAAQAGDPVLCWMRADAAGVERTLEPLADGRHFGTLQLADVQIAADAIVARGDKARAAMARAQFAGTIVVGAELCGVMRSALDLSLEYLRTRRQFGKAIGSFQALQHRAVDLYVQRELAYAVLHHALAAMEESIAPAAAAALASRVKARCSAAAVRVTREAIQLHGAIGFTDEYDAGLYLKRALVLAASYGNAQAHRRRYAELTLDAHA